MILVVNSVMALVVVPVVMINDDSSDDSSDIYSVGPLAVVGVALAGRCRDAARRTWP